MTLIIIIYNVIDYILFLWNYCHNLNDDNYRIRDRDKWKFLLVYIYIYRKDFKFSLKKNVTSI